MFYPVADGASMGVNPGVSRRGKVSRQGERHNPCGIRA
ncbi:hypothetical protein [Azospirillum largimobile]